MEQMQNGGVLYVPQIAVPDSDEMPAYSQFGKLSMPEAYSCIADCEVSSAASFSGLIITSGNDF